MDHPKLQTLQDLAKEPECNNSPTKALLDSVFLTKGKCATIVDKLVRHADRAEGIERRYEARRNGQSVENRFKGSKKLTSGIMIKNGVHSVNDREFLELIQERTKQRELEITRKHSKEKRRIGLLKDKVKQARAKKGTGFDNWSKEELKSFIQYKKRKTGDPAMPKSMPDLQERARDWLDRPSPNASPCNTLTMKTMTRTALSMKNQ